MNSGADTAKRTFTGVVRGGQIDITPWKNNLVKYTRSRKVFICFH